MRKTAQVLGILAGSLSIVLWVVFCFFNPYSTVTSGIGTVLRTFVTLLLPACLAVFASFTSKPKLFLIAFIWAFPISLYVVFTPGIFSLFGVTCLTYLACFFMLRRTRKGQSTTDSLG